MGTHKIYSGIQGIRDNISGSLYGDCHELLALSLHSKSSDKQFRGKQFCSTKIVRGRTGYCCPSEVLRSILNERVPL